MPNAHIARQLHAIGIPPKRSKYGSVRTNAHGCAFDSKKESRRYGDLLLLQASGQIHSLERQVKFPFIVNGKKLRKYYKADFVYFENGKQVLEDSKGYSTAEFKLKIELVGALYPELEIRIT